MRIIDLENLKKYSLVDSMIKKFSQNKIYKLSDMAIIKTNFPDADFWIIRRGSAKKVGKPVREYNPEYIGIKVQYELLLPTYLFYLIEYLYSQGVFESKAIGTTNLVHIRTSDIADIQLQIG